MKLITKGTWYYETQILFLVFMWRHSEYKPNNYPLKNTRGIRLGRFRVWYDTAWTHHGFPNKVRYFWLDLTKNMKVFKRWSAKRNVLRINAKNMFGRWFNKLNLVRSCQSLLAYLKLHKAGFEIGYWSDPVLEGKYARYRFFWKGKTLREFPDVMWVGKNWKMMNNGHVSYMPSDTIRGLTPNSFYQDEYITNHDGHDI